MRCLLVLTLACLSALDVLAQAPTVRAAVKPPVELQISAANTLILPGEALELDLAIRNLSGGPLVFSPNDDWLDISVVSVVKQSGEGVAMARLKPVTVNESFILGNALAAKARVEISQNFDLTRPGRYKISAAASYRGVRSPAEAEPIIVQVTSGAKLWEQEFGVRVPDSERPPETRKYQIQRLTNLKDMRLYVTVTEGGEENILRQVRLGRTAANDNPQAKLDRLSYLHVLHQSDARLFTHTVLNPDGEVMRRETFESSGPRPTFRYEEDGRVVVVNGTRRPRADDLPQLSPDAPREPLATP